MIFAKLFKNKTNEKNLIEEGPLILNFHSIAHACVRILTGGAVSSARGSAIGGWRCMWTFLGCLCMLMTVGCAGRGCLHGGKAAPASGPHTSAGWPTNQTLPLGQQAYNC